FVLFLPAFRLLHPLTKKPNFFPLLELQRCNFFPEHQTPNIKKHRTHTPTPEYQQEKNWERVRKTTKPYNGAPGPLSLPLYYYSECEDIDRTSPHLAINRYPQSYAYK